ncbi:hypothetical protein G2W53_021719 [Senna tora]|uniref:Uncharacterized protein n=1 Tax=Senna tora TaxID=362788 RepID=A0A834TKQ2_9FABA|nr:hypothetical protein G2W53_021719 [Senna tora]
MKNFMSVEKSQIPNPSEMNLGKKFCIHPKPTYAYKSQSRVTNFPQINFSDPSRASEFGHRLRPFRNGVLGQFSGQHESHGGLDLPGSDRRLLVVASEPRRLLSELLEDVVDEAVHDPHGLAGDSNVRMDLLEDLEDVDLVGLDALLASLLLLVAGRRCAFLRELLPGLRLLLRRRCLLGHRGLLLLRRFLLRGLLLGLGIAAFLLVVWVSCGWVTWILFPSVRFLKANVLINGSDSLMTCRGCGSKNSAVTLSVDSAGLYT